MWGLLLTGALLCETRAGRYKFNTFWWENMLSAKSKDWEALGEKRDTASATWKLGKGWTTPLMHRIAVSHKPKPDSPVLKCAAITRVKIGATDAGSRW